jgi:DNA-binding MurR/RpiR family transcriptional regulator
VLKEGEVDLEVLKEGEQEQEDNLEVLKKVLKEEEQDLEDNLEVLKEVELDQCMEEFL